jgi:hypothetical protein
MSRKRERRRVDRGLSIVPSRQQNEGRGAESRPSAVTVTKYHEFELRKGPIPDADELLRYGQAHAGAPEIILDEFRTQGAHRRMMERRATSLERRAMDAAIGSERLGVACALLIALVGFGCGTYLVSIGHGLEGTVIFGLDVCALVSAFILGRTLPGAEQQRLRERTLAAAHGAARRP